MNQLGAELIFKGGDLFADGRLTNSTFLCDSGEAPFFNYPHENLHCIEFVHDTLPVPPCTPFYTGDGDSLSGVLCGSSIETIRIPLGNSWYSPVPNLLEKKLHQTSSLIDPHRNPKEIRCPT